MSVGRLKIAAIVVTFVVTASIHVTHRPAMRIDRSVASDLEDIALDTWARFLHDFDAKHDCIGDLTPTAVVGLDEQGGYRAADQTVSRSSVHPPGVPGRPGPQRRHTLV